MTMMSWLLILRYLALGLQFVLSTVILILASTLFSIFNQFGLYRPLLLFCIFLAALVVVLLVPIVATGLVRPSTVASRVWFELSWLYLFLVMQLVASVLLTASNHCHLTSGCSMTETALISFSWVESAIFGAHLVTLFTCTMLHRRFFPDIWHMSIPQVPWFEYRRTPASAEFTRNGPQRSMATRHAVPPIPPIPQHIFASARQTQFEPRRTPSPHAAHFRFPRPLSAIPKRKDRLQTAQPSPPSPSALPPHRESSRGLNSSTSPKIPRSSGLYTGEPTPGRPGPATSREAQVMPLSLIIERLTASVKGSGRWGKARSDGTSNVEASSHLPAPPSMVRSEASSSTSRLPLPDTTSHPMRYIVNPSSHSLPSSSPYRQRPPSPPSAPPAPLKLFIPSSSVPIPSHSQTNPLSPTLPPPYPEHALYDYDTNIKTSTFAEPRQHRHPARDPPPSASLHPSGPRPPPPVRRHTQPLTNELPSMQSAQQQPSTSSSSPFSDPLPPQNQTAAGPSLSYPAQSPPAFSNSPTQLTAEPHAFYGTHVQRALRPLPRIPSHPPSAGVSPRAGFSSGRDALRSFSSPAAMEGAPQPALDVTPTQVRRKGGAAGSDQNDGRVRVVQMEVTSPPMTRAQMIALRARMGIRD